MSCFWPFYQRFCKLNIGKNLVIDLKRRPLLWNKNCNKLDIDTCKQLKILGDLYNDYNIKSHGFDNFFVKEIIAIKKAMILLLFLLPIGCKNNAEY